MTKEEEANLAPAAIIHVDSNENDRKPPSCCLCLNVRDGAVLIGLFNLVSNNIYYKFSSFYPL